MTKRLRIPYLDAMRGWVIFVMVWVHSTWLALGAEHVFMWSFAVVYPMPVFFAVSGYLWSYTGRQSVPWLRWMKMLVLLLAGSLGYALLFDKNIWGMFSDMYYYWFFTALLLCELCQYGMESLARAIRCSKEQMIAVGSAVLWCLFLWAMLGWGHNRFGIPWRDMEQYWLFYALGILMGRSRKLKRLLTSWKAAAIGLLLLSFGIYCGMGAGSIEGLAGGLGAVMLTWRLFESMSRDDKPSHSKNSSSSTSSPLHSSYRSSLTLFLSHSLSHSLSSPLIFLSSSLAWLGRQSLGIFLLSYPVLTWLRPLSKLMPRQWVDTTPGQWFTALTVGIPATLLMAAFTSLFKKIPEFIHNKVI